MEEKEDGFSLARHVSDKDEADNEEKDERKDKEEDEYDVEGENSSLLASIPEESEFARLLREIHMFSCSTGSSTGSEKEKEDNDESEISQASELPEEQNGSSNASEVSLEERDEYSTTHDALGLRNARSLHGRLLPETIPAVVLCESLYVHQRFAAGCYTTDWETGNGKKRKKNHAMPRNSDW
ncbi:hypothetical protein SNOG_14353 [Parastagonospora nodorum SN15]|uniref:Uncharacterized protein n=1 Tax=Phaeosphaeria nodorum (strain SN15 / ATCC MYA-4574 / FGSC 10173) TaxID=321614 RepID=Q0U1H5_PHANO|nr:hypothetical protein SNOG_14353 [Parastagonospora nodorum SN15]EAT78224.1 hypothetical protein SNOG_14353 [Parastagonospora nodorum SN15]